MASNSRATLCVRDEHALGLAGGAGGVDDIGEVVGPCGGLGVMLRRLDWGVEQKQANAPPGEMARGRSSVTTIRTRASSRMKAIRSRG